MMSIVYSILSFILGANYEILQLCPTDFAKQRKRIIVACVMSAVVWYAAGVLYAGVAPYLIAGVVLLLYITYLCKYGCASFATKFFLTLAIACFVFWGVSYPLCGGVDGLMSIDDIQDFMAASIMGVIVLAMSFTPVNFSNSDNEYFVLLAQRVKEQIAARKLRIGEKNNADKQIIHNKEQQRIKVENELTQYASEQILKVQKQAIDKIILKWIKNVETKINSNPDEFITNNVLQQISISKTSQVELDNYISELLKEKRKEFADIIIAKWAEEKAKQLKANPKAFVS